MSPVSRILYLESCLMTHVSCLMPPVSCLTSSVSGLLFHISCLMSPVSCLLSPASCLLSHVSCLLCPFSHILSHVSCLTSPVTCLSYVSCLTCCVSLYTQNYQWIGGADGRVEGEVMREVTGWTVLSMLYNFSHKTCPQLMHENVKWTPERGPKYQNCPQLTPESVLKITKLFVISP